MNKKGFTLVELMAVIAIIIFIGIIVVPGVLDIIKDNRNKGYSEIERRLEEAAAKYMANEYIDSKQDSIIITKKQLIETGYIKEIYDLKDNSVCDASIYAYNLNSVADFNPILTCSNYETKGKNAAWYIKDLYTDESLRTSNGLIEDTTTDKNIRYAGAIANVKNKVYFNCAETEGTNAYGSEKYNYASSCEIWRIIGVFDVDNGNGKIEKRVKIVRNNFLDTRMGWDTTADGVDAINQWGETTLAIDDTTPYNGAFLKQYLNDGEDSYYNSLSSIAKEQISNAVWYTGAVDKDTASGVYEDERSNATGTGTTVNYTTKWIGKIGLIYSSDFGFAGIDCGNITIYDYQNEDSCGKTRNWLTLFNYYWTISPRLDYGDAVWGIHQKGCASARANNVANNTSSAVRPSLYLKSSIKIIGGNGDTEPYILGM